MSNENEVVAAAPVESSGTEDQVVESTEESSNESNNLDASSIDSKENNVEKAKDAPKEPVSSKKKYKLKVDDQEIEEELDLSNEKDIINRLQLAKVSQKRMQEAAELKKQVADLAKVLNESPEEVLKALGKDPHDWAVQLLQKKMEDEMMDPKERELQQTKKELEELRNKAKKEEEERITRERARMQAEYEKKYEEDFTKALDSGMLAKTPLTISKLAQFLTLAIDNNYDVTAQDLIPLVKKELEAETRALIAASPDEYVEALLGKERFNSIRKKQIAAVKNNIQTASQIKASGDKIEKKEDAKEDKISISDFLRSR